MRNVWIFITLVSILILSACSHDPELGSSPPAPSPTPIAVATLPPTPLPTATATAELVSTAAAVATPEPTRPPVETPTPEPTATPSPTPEPDWLSYTGRTEEGLMFLGNPDAPVTLIDFSDFM